MNADALSALIETQLPAAANGDRKTAGAAEPNRVRNLRRVVATGDDRGLSIDRAVPHGAHAVVVVMVAGQELSGKARLESFEVVVGSWAHGSLATEGGRQPNAMTPPTASATVRL